MQSKPLQKKAFHEYEANQWFSRNKYMLEKYNAGDDLIVKGITQYNIKPLRILEIGSSAGYRLNHLKKLFPSALVAGIDLSADAIQAGKKSFPELEL